MNQMQVKEVDFNGATLLAAQTEDGKVWVGVKWICEGLGLTEGQIKSERKKIQNDLVISKGGRNLILPTSGGEQETLVLNIDFLPLWLAKISITPSMQENSPEVVEKLIEYQLKAKDVLAKEFLNKMTTYIGNYLDMSEEDRAIAFFTSKKELKVKNELLEIQKPKIEMYDKMISAENDQEMNIVAKAFKKGRNKFFKFLREKGILMKNNTPYQKYIDSGYFTVIEAPKVINDKVVNFPKTLVKAKGLEFLGEILREEEKQPIQ